MHVLINDTGRVLSMIFVIGHTWVANHVADVTAARVMTTRE